MDKGVFIHKTLRKDRQTLNVSQLLVIASAYSIDSGLPI